MVSSHFPKLAAEALDLQNTALFLDVDGTLLDIAATPESVVVPDGLAETIGRLEQALGGALAIVTGRELADLDRLFFPLRTRAAGVHGAEMRYDPTRPASAAPDSAKLSADLWREFVSLAGAFPGVAMEDKFYSFTAHYRAAPEAAPALRAALLRLVEAHRDLDLQLLDGRCAFEIKPSSFDKGEAVRRFLERPPFVGRRPIFIGDDVSDEYGFRYVSGQSGVAFAVGAPRKDADDVFADPATVRRWLERLAEPAAA
ncbi:MAG: trehalose-phosphatase [Bradyrhizobium sp.]|nr:MAG: trehalose-phosphatase [Bradyrhizobium sp.]